MDAYKFSFVTVKRTSSPLVVRTDPHCNAMGVPVNKTIVLAFNDTVRAGITYDRISLSNKENTVAITKKINGDELVISPLKKMAYESWHTLIIPVGAIKNLIGNKLAKPLLLLFSTGSQN